ncbi:hypothetical protein NQ318_023031 [Aromia moschata]|uniref:Uncharacterized protein n=1 Tax=Aromia moschata TaxID=1265417 RepID=A0AAV8XXB7_9CUCU|nr:hypothetical protein NQ318_023031 [Aromia moschata]
MPYVTSNVIPSDSGITGTQCCSDLNCLSCLIKTLLKQREGRLASRLVITPPVSPVGVLTKICKEDGSRESFFCVHSIAAFYEYYLY